MFSTYSQKLCNGVWLVWVKTDHALNVTVGYDRISITLSMLHVCSLFYHWTVICAKNLNICLMRKSRHTCNIERVMEILSYPTVTLSAWSVFTQTSHTPKLLSNQQSLTYVATATTLKNRNSEWLLFIAKRAIFQPNHGENKLL
jgi:hypothetical protein